MALALAVDISASVDAAEYRMQRDGLAAALDHDDVRRAILQGAPGHVALIVYEWSGRYQQQVVLPWAVLDSPRSIDIAVARLAASRRSYDQFPTAMGYALGYGAGLLKKGPDCARRVLDISGDGENNEGFHPAAAYRNFPFEGVTVNGLAILGSEAGVEEYYDRNVPHGPGAFVARAAGFADFQSAMTRKLFREINDLMIGIQGAAPWRG
ncbi:DUF1194 domain-containing protein [Pseudooceanicola aestuarii]|uniref:DUF1194 domain-containing protein n=1 Tax=Pseudooceanicola aestuarii TaxID=2697319 RepID=UPI0030846CF6